jgi:hypothetical protein
VKNNGRTLLVAACCLMLILSAGCAALSPTKQEPLEERVKNYMQALIDRRWDRAYEFLDSSSRETVTRESYISRTRRLPYQKFTIDEVTVAPSGDQATVKIKTDVTYKTYTFKGASHVQLWVREKGAWFIRSAPPSKSNPFQEPFLQQEKQK